MKYYQTLPKVDTGTISQHHFSLYNDSSAKIPENSKSSSGIFQYTGYNEIPAAPLLFQKSVRLFLSSVHKSLCFRYLLPFPCTLPKYDVSLSSHIFYFPYIYGVLAIGTHFSAALVFFISIPVHSTI